MNSTYVEKPLAHYTWGAWQSYNDALSRITKFKNTTSNCVRQDSEQLRSDTKNTISWKLRDTNFRLSDRISDVEQWHRNLDRTLTEVKNQIQNLSDSKTAIENALVGNIPLLEAVKECLHLQDRRREIDLVEDDVYKNLLKEMRLLDSVCNQLRERGHQDWEQLVKLKEVRDRLIADMNDKSKTRKIDRYQLELHPASSDISFKPWPLEIPEGTVSEQQWLDFSVKNRADAETEAAKGMQLTNNSWALIRNTNNDIAHQREGTQYALRVRQHETLQTRDRLAAQRKDLSNEIARMDDDIRRLEAALYDTRGPLKLAHTRLENRKWRPGMDLCADVPQRGLREEVSHLVESRESLTQQLKDARNVLNGLQQHLHEVEEDLARKERSLELENSCWKIHGKPSKAPYQTEIAWLSDNSYLLSSLERGAFERVLSQENINRPLWEPGHKIAAGTMTDNIPDERLLID